jgi:cytochrome-b5 reductase
MGLGVVCAALYTFRPSNEQHVAFYNRKKQQIEGAPKVFTGGDQGFVKLKLTKSQEISHNTKRLTFTFDDDTAVSGLQVACMRQSRIC